VKTYTIQEAAKKLEVTKAAVYKAIREGKLKATSGIIQIREDQLAHYSPRKRRTRAELAATQKQEDSQTRIPLFFE
jgi:predicted DNA-binding protein YlxM (UPF0122 family)